MELDIGPLEIGVSTTARRPATSQKNRKSHKGERRVSAAAVASSRDARPAGFLLGRRATKILRSR